MLLPPDVPQDIDYLVTESTYGNRTHSEIDPLHDLEEIINRTTERNGVIIVPAFAVGRAQTLLHYLARLKKNNLIPQIPIYLNSPMATNVTGLYCDHKENHKLSSRECHEMCNIATYVNSAEESIRLNLRRDPMLIVSASGMVTGGRVVHHIKAFAPNKQNTLLFTGFQAAATRGKKIVSGNETVRIHGQDIPINAEVCNLNSLSAHADSKELIDWMGKIKRAPKKVFITHGEPSAASELKSKIEKVLNWNATIPEYLDEVDL